MSASLQDQAPRKEGIGQQIPSWFRSFAPGEDPETAIGVFLSGAGSGTFLAPSQIARDLYPPPTERRFAAYCRARLGAPTWDDDFPCWMITTPVNGFYLIAQARPDAHGQWAYRWSAEVERRYQAEWRVRDEARAEAWKAFYESQGGHPQQGLHRSSPEWASAAARTREMYSAFEASGAERAAEQAVEAPTVDAVLDATKAAIVEMGRPWGRLAGLNGARRLHGAAA